MIKPKYVEAYDIIHRGFKLKSKLSPCFEWKGHKDKDGYGRCNPKYHLGENYWHRYMYKKYIGKYPKSKPITDHLCRNHPCGNPLHIEAVTQQTNVVRGNLPKLLGNLRRKISSKDARVIARMYEKNSNVFNIATAFNVSDVCIRYTLKAQGIKVVRSHTYRKAA